MRVALVGKGGVGKSAVAGTFARMLARRGEPVLAVDSDPMPGLAYCLGMPVDDAAIPEDAVVERAEGEKGPRFRLRPGLAAEQAVAQFAVPGPDGVHFLQFGKLRSGRDHFRSQFAFRQILAELPVDAWHLVGDLPGGTRQPFFGWGSYADTVLVVVEPTAKALLTGRKLARLAQAKHAPERIYAVVNRVRRASDVDDVTDRTGLEVIGVVPWDDEFAAAERAGEAPIDAVPDAAAVVAVEQLVDAVAGERTS
ncbi:nucleotide-binding protein [Pseudonocardia nigra]|uniref:nucleotide-binding protein n=1 Tax=Pseudonocardia nigra TaxID=1921578 RepID=UPI001C5F7294|nr:ArsA-related P-loop ATPase [Pseudonocardia nigra]